MIENTQCILMINESGLHYAGKKSQRKKSKKKEVFNLVTDIV